MIFVLNFVLPPIMSLAYGSDLPLLTRFYKNRKNFFHQTTELLNWHNRSNNKPIHCHQIARGNNAHAKMSCIPFVFAHCSKEIADRFVLDDAVSSNIFFFSIEHYYYFFCKDLIIFNFYPFQFPNSINQTPQFHQ